MPRSSTDTGTPGGPLHRARRILVVEDEIILAVQIEGCLSDDGHDVIDIVHTAADAVTVAIAEKPDLVIMDVGLGGDSDGIAAACEILARTGIRSIFATAHADQATRDRGIIARPLAWLEKPFGLATILDAVNSAFPDP